MNPQSNRKHDAARIALATVAVLCLALAPAAAAQEVAQVRAGSSSIDFNPVVANGGLVLTVSGPDGFHHRAEFGPGEAPSFSIFDQAGGVLPDGSYKYELTAVPTQTQRREAFEANQVQSKGGGVPARIQSGGFSIVGGAVVAGGEVEPGAETAGSGGNPLATKDFVINDDLIVTLSACIGNDCVNGETFGFDTLRLKENNLRIKFEDTSVGSFPTVDWEIQANDSANGGQSWFRVNDVDNGTSPFTIEANTPSHTLYVDSAKRVGIGTSTPVLDLHISTTNTPGLRLAQTNAGGFSAQTWDIAGNEANFFVRDVTGGSRLPLRIRPGAPTSSLDIAASGNVGIGTTAPSQDLDVQGRAVFSDGFHGTHAFHRTGSGVDTEIQFKNQVGTSRWFLHFDGSTPEDLFIYPNASTQDLILQTNEGGTALGRVGIGTNNPQGTLDVNGTIFLSGSQIHPDYVFEPDHELESIEEHASYMWEHKHLPAVGPGVHDEEGRGVIELGGKTMGMLEELEKAHIYIEQLHERLARLEAQLVER